MQATYISPLTDFGFKKLFGETRNKDLLISFLSSLLPETHQIHDLQYTRNEHRDISPLDQGSIFNLRCVSTQGEQFVVELRKVKRAGFKDRSLYYSTFAIQEQAARSDWDYRLSAVYNIGILDFVMDGRGTEVLHHVQLKDHHNQVFFGKLNFIYITLPCFRKQVHELETLQDKWLYALCNLPQLDEPPEGLQEAIFGQLFEESRLANFEPHERWAYDESLRDYRDLKNILDTAYQAGREEGGRV